MKKSLALCKALALLLLILSCSNRKAEDQNTIPALNSTENKLLTEQLNAANDSFYSALNTMFTGDVEPLYSIWSHADYITQMGPFGGMLKGWEAVSKEFKNVADKKLGGKIVCSDKHMYSGTDIGYIVCVEEGENIGPDGKPVRVSHRATNIFHLENGQWKLIHHHTDISTQLENTYEELKNK